MTWAIPNWYALVLIALAVFRLWRLLAEDDILDKPRGWFLRKTPKAEAWLACPWCAGAWITLAWWLAWVAWPHWATILAVPLAISAIVGLVGSNLDPD